MFMFVRAAPGAATEDGVNVTLTPAGWPVAVKVRALSKLPATLVVIIKFALLFRVRDTTEELTDNEKSGVSAARVISTFSSAIVAHGFPLISVSSRRRTYCPCVGLKVTVLRLLSPTVVINTPLE